MDKITKFLLRLTPKERERVNEVMGDLVKGTLHAYERKKMKGYANLYRIRVGDIRIVYLEIAGERRILLIDRRNDNTYQDF